MRMTEQKRPLMRMRDHAWIALKFAFLFGVLFAFPLTQMLSTPPTEGPGSRSEVVTFLAFLICIVFYIHVYCSYCKSELPRRTTDRTEQPTADDA
jgi:hypothetical protein